MSHFILTVIVFLSTFVAEPAHLTVKEKDLDRSYVLSKINDLRQQGCRCGNTYYGPAESLEWNDLLYKSALTHARSMHQYRYFSHISPNGQDVGDRLDEVGYYWQYAGENLAEGQKSFDEVLEDWLASGSHCKMIMNPRMKEIGVARYGDYWVQHFGKKMPRKSRRINRIYKEG